MKNRNVTFTTILLVVGWFALCEETQAVIPPPDGGYPNFNTAEGQNALFSLTTGAANTAVGWYSLFSNTDGSFNTGVGAGALLFNIGNQNTGEGIANTGIGAAALLFNTDGNNNTAVGTAALLNNTVGPNTAVGYRALSSNTTGERNTAIGFQALANGNAFTNFSNTAVGDSALFSNTSGQSNTAMGGATLFNNVSGDFNTAVGPSALSNNVSGSGNIGIGSPGGGNVTGDHNIDIGNPGVAGESNKIRIGEAAIHDGTFVAGISGIPVTGAAVLVASGGQLGTMASSQRFKEEIKAMDTASEAILALKPVTFHYNKEIDPATIPQFGLVAEEVEKVNPDLVVHDKEGKPYSVRYDQVNAMLLNEFLKEHRKVHELEAKVANQQGDFEANNAKQQEQIRALTARLDKQAAQIQKVSAQIEASKLARRVVKNDYR
jgi:Chaperone of endosialidase